MRKIKNFIFLILIGILFNIDGISAEAISFSKVVQNFENSERIKMLEDSGATIDVFSSDSIMTIAYYGINNDSYVTNFSYSDGKIIYQNSFGDNITTEEEANALMVNSMWISELIVATGKTYGYDTSCWDLNTIQNIVLDNEYLKLVKGNLFSISTSSTEIKGNIIDSFEFDLVNDPFTKLSKVCITKQNLDNEEEKNKTFLS